MGETRVSLCKYWLQRYNKYCKLWLSLPFNHDKETKLTQ